MLRHELPEDYKEVESIIYEAFESSSLYKFEEPTEHKLVAELRKTDDYIPELSIVVQEGWEIVGHAISTIAKLEGESSKDILVLSPMSVKPILQKTGVGLQLIMETIDTAKRLGYGAVAVLGPAEYYPRFGFLPAKDFNITCNIDKTDSQLFVMELEKGYLDKNAKIIYPDIFLN